MTGDSLKLWFTISSHCKALEGCNILVSETVLRTHFPRRCVRILPGKGERVVCVVKIMYLLTDFLSELHVEMIGS